MIVSGAVNLGDGQGGKLVTDIGHQFITLTIHICVKHNGREAVLRRAGLSGVKTTEHG